MKHYPIALTKNTKQLIDISKVNSGLDCNCICLNCENDLYAINKDTNKVKKHFRHAASPCNITLETYLHYITKEFISKYDIIKLPEIDYELINPIRLIEIYDNFLKQFEEEDKNIILEFILSIPKIEFNKFQFNKIILQKNGYFNYMFISKEKIIIVNDFEKIKPDIIIKSNNELIFVEPFLTSKIDSAKYSKIKDNFNVISLDLRTFRKNYKNNFKVMDLKKYIVDEVSNKKWISVSDQTTNNLLNKLNLNNNQHFQNYIRDNFSKIKRFIELKRLPHRIRNDYFTEYNFLWDKLIELSSINQK